MTDELKLVLILYFSSYFLVIGIVLGYKDGTLINSFNQMALTCLTWPFLFLLAIGYWIGRLFQKLDKIL